MKLIFCPHCHDIVKLGRNKKYCDCMNSYGYYLNDGVNALINKKAIPIGIDNYSFAESISNRPEIGLGRIFEAFVIPNKCDSIKIIKD